MIEIQVFFHQAGIEVFQLPAVPRAGEFIRNVDDNVFRVASVLWQPAGRVKVFAVPITQYRASELETEWAAWGERQTRNADQED